MTLKYASLCAGYGGLDRGVMSVLGGELTWYAEFDDAPSKIMEHHHPGIPNLRDITKIDWATCEPVDVMTAGFPCQPFSGAGKQLGADDPRHLWPYIAKGIAALRPRLVVLENVRGLLSAKGERDTPDITPYAERVDRITAVIKARKARNASTTNEYAVRLAALRKRAVADLKRRRSVLIRAIGVVLRDLADIGYDAWWYGLQASDVGGAHGRYRIFIYATPANSGGFGGFEAVEHDGRGSSEVHGPSVLDQSDRDALRDGPERSLTLLPTPAVNDMGAGKTVDDWDAWTDRMKSAHGNGNGHGKSLHIEAQRLLPTPRATDGTKGGPNQRGSSGDLMLPSAVHSQDWREYEAAIRRAENALGRPAPAPTETGPKGSPRLSPAFVEWLMMLPACCVTNPDIGLSRNDQLKALGNGVVPPQAAAATRAFVADVQAQQEAVAS